MKKSLLCLLSLSMFSLHLIASETREPVGLRLVKSFYHLEDVEASIGKLVEQSSEGHAVITTLSAAKTRVETAQTLLKNGLVELDNDQAMLLLSQRILVMTGSLALNFSTARFQLNASGDLDEAATKELDHISELLKKLKNDLSEAAE